MSIAGKRAGSAYGVDALENRIMLTAPPYANAADVDAIYDSAGVLHVAWYDSSTHQLKYAYRSGGNWLGPSALTSASMNAGTYVSLAVDTSNPNHVGAVYREDDPVSGAATLKYIKETSSGTWSTPLVVESGGTSYASLIFDSSGNPVVSYYRTTSHTLKVGTLNGSSFTTTTVDNGGGTDDVGKWTSLARSSTGKLGLAYYDQTTIQVKYREFTSGSWSSADTVDTLTGSSAYISLAFDGSGHPAVVYYNGRTVDGQTGGLAFNIKGSTWPAASNLTDRTSHYENLYFNGSQFQVVYEDTVSDDVSYIYGGNGSSWNSATFGYDATGAVASAFTTAGDIGYTHSGSDGLGMYVDVRPAALSIPPVLSTPTVSTSGVSLGWTNISGETGYEVWRSGDGGVTWTSIGSTAANVVTYLDSAVTGADGTTGKTFTYSVRGIDGTDASLYSNQKSATFIPETPGSFTVTTLSSNQMRLDWADVAGETSYKIERSPDGSASTFTTVYTTAADATTWTDNSGLSAGTPYWYRISASNSSGDSAPTGKIGRFTVPTAPGVPTITVASAPATEVDLSWTSVFGADSYEVQRSDDGASWSQVGAPVTNSFEDTTVTAGSSYYYRVVAVNSGGNSDNGASSLIVTVPPPQPTIASANGVSASQIDLTWLAVTGATSYRIERSPDGSTGWTTAGTAGSGATSYSDTGRTAGTTYWYRLFAVNAGGDSVASPVVSAATLSANAVVWDGGGDGSSWSDRFNWSGDALPTTTSDVTINVAGSPTINYTAGSTTIHSLTTNASLNISGGTLSIISNGSASLAGTTTVSGGTLNLAGTWSNSGTLAISSGTLNLGGTFSTSGLGTWSRSGGMVNLTGTLNNTGSTLTLDANTGSWNFSNGTIQGGTITTSDGSTFNWAATGSGTLDGVTLNTDVTVPNSRTLNVKNGLVLNSTLTLNATSTSAFTTLDFLTGVQTLSGTGSVLLGGTVGYGRVLVQGVSSSVPATLTIAAGMTIHGFGLFDNQFSADSIVNNGTIDADLSGQLDFPVPSLTNNGTLQASVGTLFVRPTNWINNGTISVTGGTLTTDGAWSNAGTLSISSGTVNLGGTFTTADLGTWNRSGGNVNFSGTLDNTGSTFTLDATTGSWNFNNGTILGGTISFSGGSTLGFWQFAAGTLDGVTLNSDLTIPNARVLHIKNSLVLNSTLTLDPTSMSGAFTSLDFLNGAQTLSGSGTIVMGGTVDMGQLLVHGASSTAPATLTIAAGMTVHGRGLFDTQFSTDNLINNGTIDADLSGGKLDFVIPSLTNNGTLQASVGTLFVRPTNWINNGTISVTAGTLTTGGAWSNAGTLSISSGTVNLGGTFTTAGLGTWNRSGGTVNLTGTLDNTNTTFTLDGNTGSWNFSNGTIQGGTIATSDGSTFNWAPTGSGTLDGVTLNSDFTIPDFKTLNIKNSLVLNGTLTINPSSSLVVLNNAQTLSGSGSLVLGGTTAHGQVHVQGTSTTPATLTIASGMEVRGAGQFTGETSADSLINNGSIYADVPGQTLDFLLLPSLTNNNILQAAGGTLSIRPTTFTNSGLVEALNSSVLTIGSSTTFTNTGTVALHGDASVTIGTEPVDGSLYALSGTELALDYHQVSVPVGGSIAFKQSVDDETFTLASPTTIDDDTVLLKDVNPNTQYSIQTVVTNSSGGIIQYTSDDVTTANLPDQSGRYQATIVAVDGSGNPTSTLLTSYHVSPDDAHEVGGDLWDPGTTIDWSLPSAPPEAGSAAGSTLVDFAGLPVPTGDAANAVASNTTGSLYLYHIFNWWYRTGDLNVWHGDDWGLVDSLSLVPTPPPGASKEIFALSLSAVPAVASPDDGHPEDPNAVGENPAANSKSVDPIRYFDGSVVYETTDLESDGFGQPMTQGRYWTNRNQFETTRTNGHGMIDTDRPGLVSVQGTTTLDVVLGPNDVREFSLVNGQYVSASFVGDKLWTDNGDYVFSDTLGNQTRFYGFDPSLPTMQRGQFEQYLDAGGNETYNYSLTPDGTAQEIRRRDASGTDLESWLYSYLPSTDANGGLLSNVQLRRPDGSGGWNVARQVDYSYYTSGDSNGNLGDLKTATIKDGSGLTIDTKYYRYYTPGEAAGYVHGLKYVFDETSFARLAAAVSDPFTATDAQVAPFATHYFEYDSERRVTTHVIAGMGSSASGGLGRFTYEYFTSTNADDANAWKYKTIETLPDGNQNIVYCNDLGEVMLKVFNDVNDPTNASLNGKQWGTFYKYDSAGRILWQADPSAVSLPAALATIEQYADLLNNQSGNYQYLADSAGLIHVTQYYSSTTAGETTAGGVNGYVQSRSVQHGEMGTPIVLQTNDYFNHTSGAIVVSPEASETMYRNSDGTGGATTSYAYSWFTGTAQMQSMTTTHPVVATSEHGNGAADSSETVFDIYGRVLWTKDESGYLNYTGYDLGTGAVVKSIIDVDTTKSGDFSDLPSGWATITGGGLHLITAYAVDALGRTTATTDPNGNVTYTTYDDADHEIRTYRGWNATTEEATGPTEVTRLDRAGSYTESLTMSATPHLTGGVPDGTEAIGSVQSLARQYTNAAGQEVASDRYFNLSGLSYSTDPDLGVLDTNYYRTTYGYDADGNQNRIANAVGTVTITLFDGLGRSAAVFVGTDDSTTDGGPWTPGTASPTSNMVQTQSAEYDSNDVGDGDLTQVTMSPDGSSSDDRISINVYDWRDRLISTKSGAQATEQTDVNRPLVVRTLDNLGEVTAERTYDGDGIDTADADGDGVPDSITSSTLRSELEYAYDVRGRVCESSASVINQSTGAIDPTALVTDTWYDPRGFVLKTEAPNGLVSKQTYDGAGRVIATYSTDGGGDSTLADAADVLGDLVLQESHTTYDPNGNAILTTNKLRFGDEVSTATGALGDSTTGPKARVTYTAAYFDAANRKIADVNVGTNGDVAFSRPSSVPSRADSTLVTTYGYDGAGRLQDVTDPRGIISRNEYDAAGRTTSTIADYTDGTPTNSSNQTTTYTYDGLDHVLTKTNIQPAGSLSQTTQYVYGVTSGIFSNDLLKETRFADPDTGSATTSNRISYTYNRLGEMTGMTEQLGAVHAYDYDPVGRRVSDSITTSDGSGNPETGFQYDTLGNVAAITDPNGYTTDYVYDSLGRKLQVVQPSPDGVSSRPTTNDEYDAAGNLTSVTDANDHTTSYTYDLLGRRLSQTQPDPDDAGSQVAPVTTYGYNIGGTSNTVTDPLGNLSGADPALHTTTTTFDRFGRTASVTGPSPDGTSAAPTTNYTYDRDGNILTTTDALTNTTTFTYDDLNRKTGQTLPDPDGSGPLSAPVTTYGYDAQGNVVSTIDPLNRETTYAYDALNRQTRQTLPDPDGAGSQTASVTQYEYDVAGNLVSVTDPLGKVTNDDYNQLNRKISQTLPDPDGAGALTSPVTSYAYDLSGNLTSQTDPAGNITTYDYDHLNRETSETTHTTAQGDVTRSSTYDPVGNVLTTTDRNGRVIRYTYDNLNRQISEEWLDASSQVIHTISSTYDVKGRLASIGDSDSSYTFSYDNLDRATTIDNNGTANMPHVVLTQTFDLNGNRTALSTSVDGVADFTNAYGFDALNRIDEIQQSGTGISDKRVDYGYRADGAYDSITRYSDLRGTSEVATSTYGYDSAGRLTSLTHTNGSTTLADYTWNYDANGRITSFVSADGTTTYSYDDNGQLTAVDNPGSLPDETYSYDANGNRTNSGYSTDDDNRLTTDGTYNYEYDAEGNRTKRTNIATGDYEEYTYDYRNRLTGIAFFDSTDTLTKQVRYTYDVLNRRIGKEIDADADNTYETVERYVYDGDNIVIVFDGSGTLLQRYLQGAGVDDPVAQENAATGDVSWMLPDDQGSVRDVIHSSAASIDHIIYDGFGNIASRTGTEPLRYAYTGRELDAETGLYYYRRRYYDAAIGQFISQDPTGFSAGDTNLYRYVANSTPNRRDPSGLEADQNRPTDWTGLLPGAMAGNGPIVALEDGQTGVLMGRTTGGNDIYELPAHESADDLAREQKMQQSFEQGQRARQELFDSVAQLKRDTDASGAILNSLIKQFSDTANESNQRNQSIIGDDDLFNKQADFAKGYFWDAPKGIVSGGVNLLLHPVDSAVNIATGLGELISDPRAVWDAATKDSRSQGAALGSIAWGLVTGKIGGELGDFAKSKLSNLLISSKIPAKTWTVTDGLSIGDEPIGPLNNGVRSANTTSIVERDPLDWSIVKQKTGETRWEHLQRHAVDNPGRPGLHGVFDNDPVLTTQEAWYRGQLLGVKPSPDGTYVIPMGRRVGWEGGSLGTGQALENITIHTADGQKIITAYPTR